MAIAAHHRHCMLSAECGDPDIVSWDRRASGAQLQPDGRIVPGGFDVNIKDSASVQHSLERPFVRLSVPGLRDTESELPGDDNRDRKLIRLRDNLDRGHGFV
jgi:hypothetical protein